jgi:hypothetical protein
MLAGVDVSTPADLPTGALALYGDQTVNSDTAAGDGVSQLSDDIAAAFVNDPNGDGTVPYGILNVGGSMNTNHGQMPTVLNSPTPRNASGSIDRNVLNHDNVRTVLVSYGTGDLLQCMATDANACAAPIEDKLTRVSAQLRSYYTDDSTNLNVSIANESGSLTVYVATIPPFTGAHTDVQEQARLLLNAFILDAADQRYLNGFADGAIDFAAAVSADGTDTSPAVKDADLTGGAPNNQYYQDLGQRYVQDSEPSDGTVNVQPNFVGSIVPMQ